MADLNPSFAEGLMQGAQLLNQAIQFNIQQKQQQAEFAERVKQHRELTQFQEQKMSLEREVLELDKQKFQFQQEVEQAKLLGGAGNSVSQLKFEVETALENYLTGQPMPINEAANKSLGQIRHMRDEAEKQLNQYVSSPAGMAALNSPNSASPFRQRYDELSSSVTRLKQAEGIRETQRSSWVDALPPEKRSALGFTTRQEEANAIVQQAQQPLVQGSPAQRATSPEPAPTSDENSFDGAIEAARTTNLKDSKNRQAFIRAAADQLQQIQSRNNRFAGTQKIQLLFQKMSGAFPTDSSLTTEILGELQARRNPKK